MRKGMTTGMTRGKWMATGRRMEMRMRRKIGREWG